jgi:hypothetical protein
MGWDNIQSIIRAVLVASGGFLVKQGIVTDAQWQDLVGAILVVVAVAWSVYQNHQANKAKIVSAALGVPVQQPLVGVATVANAVPTATGAADVVKAKAA